MNKFLSNSVRAILEITLPLRMRMRKGASCKPLSGKKDGVVVSLTSFPARIGNVWMTLDSLFRQERVPDRIVLVLTEEEFPGGLAEVPESVLRFIPSGLEIVFLPFNLRCHNKYWWPFANCPGATVITVDDDCEYRKDTVSRLLDLGRKYPGAVCCNIAAVIDPGRFNTYSAWRKSSAPSAPGHLNIALGFAGILYPPSVDRTPFLEKDLAMKLAPTADDLWLKAVETDRRIPVATGKFFPKPVTIKSSQTVSLRKVNKGTENWNDIQWKALDGHFHLKEKLL